MIKEGGGKLGWNIHSKTDWAKYRQILEENLESWSQKSKKKLNILLKYLDAKKI